MSNVTFYVPKLKEKGAWLDWRGNYPGGYGWRGDRPLSAITKVVIHHTVTNPEKNAKKEIDLVKKIHVDSNKWGGIGYHIIISSEVVNGYAKAAYVGDLGSIRAHAPDTKGRFVKAGSGNYYYIGISIIGRLHEKAPSAEQMLTAHEIVKELIYAEDKRLPKLKDWQVDMIGHWDVDSTSCPGNAWDYKANIIKPPNNMEEINKLKKQLSDMTKDRDNYKKKYDNANKELTDIKKSVDNLNKTVDNLSKQIESEVKARQALANQIENVLQSTNTKTLEELKTQYKESKDLVEEMQELQNSFSYRLAKLISKLLPNSK